jgi:endonuclease G
MNIKPSVDQTIDRLQSKLPQLRKTVQNRKPKDLVPPERLARRARFAAAPGVAPTALDLERILGDNDLLNLNYLERGLRSARPVGRIIFVGAGGQPRGYATGFMVTPRLLLTNHHVFGAAAEAAGAVLEFDYEVDLAGRPRPTERFRFRPQDYFFAHQALDFALVAVDPQPLLRGTSLDDYGWLQLNPALGKINPGEYVSIIQHPGGEPKQISVRENQLVELGDTRLTYLCDTAPGSSGSPVFNDSWQIVALHHSGVPARDKQGRWLGPDGRPAPPNATENQIKWVANEGIRVSSLMDCVERYAPRGARYTELMACAKLDGGGLRLPESRAAVDSGATTDGNSSNNHSSLRQDASGMIVSVPVSFRVSWLGARNADGAPALTTPIAAAAPAVKSNGNGASNGGGADEVKIIDPDFSSRKGYLPDFLGVKVPLPTLTTAGMKSVSRMLNDTSKKSHIIPYHHFSVVMNAPRRLCFFAANNYDHSAQFRGKLSRKQLGSDNWDPDPRIDVAHQIRKEEIYDATDFDLGHVVMRENNYWGQTEQEAVFANWDTFYFTNCTPQHFAFNRENQDGIWGALEKHIADQLKAQGDRLSIFAGPVLSKTDKIFRGVPIPKQYWKVIVAKGNTDKLSAWGFLLSQEDLIKDMEADFQPGPFETFHVSLASIEDITQVRFPEVVKHADVKTGAGPNESLRLTILEDLTLPRRQTRLRRNAAA